MGLFTKEKTTKDYLKEIAEAQKSDAKIARNRFDAEKEAIKAQRSAEIAKEQMRIDQHNKETRETLLRQMVTISFNPEQPNSIVQTLTELGSQIDMWLKKPGKYKRHLEVARSKYDMGIAVLSGAEPTNTMLPYFTKQYTKWDKRLKKQRTTSIVTWSLHIILLLAFGKAAANHDFEHITAVIFSVLVFIALFRLLGVVFTFFSNTFDDNE